MKNKTAQETKSAVIRRLSNHPDELVKSITYDNGSENVLHQEINDKLGAQSFFCEPYHSWEKGSVEQVNGLDVIYLKALTSTMSPQLKLIVLKNDSTIGLENV